MIVSCCLLFSASQHTQMYFTQIRFTTLFMATLVLCFVALWFTGKDPCANYAVLWLGNMPLTLAATVVVCIFVCNTQPRIPSDGAARPNAVLQEWAWTERGAAEKLAHRAAGMCSQVAPSLRNEPMFCTETACKCFVWASLMYDYTEIDASGSGSGSSSGRSNGSGRSGSKHLPESARVLAVEIDLAMGLFGLEKRHLFYDRKLETKVVVAWNADTIMLAARGSATSSNWLEDAKVPRACPAGLLFASDRRVVDARLQIRADSSPLKASRGQTRFAL